MYTELRREIDYGTPARISADSVTLEIDSVAVTVPKGTSLMRAAAEAGIGVPKLCATDSLQAFGSCRLCLVEIEGRKGYPASCTTPAEAGMRLLRTPRRPNSAPAIRITVGLRNAPESWRDYLYWNVELDDEN